MPSSHQAHTLVQNSDSLKALDALPAQRSNGVAMDQSVVGISLKKTICLPRVDSKRFVGPKYDDANLGFMGSRVLEEELQAVVSSLGREAHK